ncbi:FAD binding domain-containing protein [Fomitopsis serialis]|uniref:FAD binding domain-containing protein n=1 Tax=Fomitopsis serialis TaxID=139415 RepID=UPI0020083455|nr:FAD binding domain-containing protein [Neoantrodia serialis]KAH9933927.1 FAD binding domain-containing protein [Neoantrodia serialis]
MYVISSCQGVFDPLCRGSVTVKDGQATASRGWGWIEKAVAGKTYFDFCMCIRQRYVEDAMLSAIAELNEDAVRPSVKLMDYSVDESSDHPVAATLQVKEGQLVRVRCKYLVGADGGRSTVRALSNIAFPGVSSPHKWVRLDAIVKTDLPHRQHGNVLWIPTDNGRTRIGFVLKNELYGVDGMGVTADVVMEEAKKALQPNSLEFLQLDWWTVYAVGQRAAEQFKKGRVFLAGDAAHTHSSGSGQGMNTGIQDATNLAWKLAGVVKGWYKEEILEVYDSERRALAQHLIELDKETSSLISGKIPARFNALPDANVNDYLYNVFEESAAVNVGLGISYPENLLNQTYPGPGNGPSATVSVGHRGPDAALFRPGAKLPRRLHELTASAGNRFTILVFAGAVRPVDDFMKLDEASAARYRELRQHVDSEASFTRTLADVFVFLSIVRGEGVLQPAEALGVSPLGKMAYDHSGDAYDKYGVRAAEGALVVLRPDGIVGFVAPLDMDGMQAVGRYFQTFVNGRAIRQQAMSRDTGHTIGEMSVEGQEESTRLV